MSSADAWMHLVLFGFSVALLSISMRAYGRRPVRRYFFLVIAFLFLAVSSAINFVESMFLSGNLILIPILGVHISHLFDLLMLLSFGVALMRSTEGEYQKLEHRKLQ